MARSVIVICMGAASDALQRMNMGSSMMRHLLDKSLFRICLTYQRQACSPPLIKKQTIQFTLQIIPKISRWNTPTKSCILIINFSFSQPGCNSKPSLGGIRVLFLRSSIAKVVPDREVRKAVLFSMGRFSALPVGQTPRCLRAK